MDQHSKSKVSYVIGAKVQLHPVRGISVFLAYACIVDQKINPLEARPQLLGIVADGC